MFAGNCTQKYARYGMLAALVLLYVLSLACGASRSTARAEGEEVELDELLGEDQITASNLESEEAEVLRLLGIEPTQEPEQLASTAEPASQSGLEEQLSQLQKELEEKDREISRLRAELTAKESRISDLQMQSQSQSRRAVPAGKPGQPSPEFKARYKRALELFNSRDYQSALNIFKELLQSDPNNSLSDNCQYWIGECYYGLRDFNQAIVEFERVFSFPNSNKADDAQLKLGLCYLKLGDRQQARAEFERLLSNYPDSEYVSLAERYLARM